MSIHSSHKASRLEYFFRSMEEGKISGGAVTRKNALKSPDNLKSVRVDSAIGMDVSADGIVSGNPPPGIPLFPSVAAGSGVVPGQEADGVTDLDEDPVKLSDIMQEMKQMNLNMVNQFEHVRIQLENQASSFKNELEQLHTDMVSKDQFL